MKVDDKDVLPEEWLELIEYAKNSGVTKLEFKEFLEEKSKEDNNYK